MLFLRLHKFNKSGSIHSEYFRHNKKNIKTIYNKLKKLRSQTFNYSLEPKRCTSKLCKKYRKNLNDFNDKIILNAIYGGGRYITKSGQKCYWEITVEVMR